MERDLVERSDLLDALLAAEAGLHSGPTHASEAPRSITAWAMNAYQSELSLRRRPARAAGRRRRWFSRPIFAAAAATLVLLIAAGVGTYFGLRQPDRIVATSDKKAKQPGEKWNTRGNSIFKDPENAIFDGLDVE